MIIPCKQSYFTIIPQDKNYYHSIFCYYHSHFYPINYKKDDMTLSYDNDMNHERRIKTSLQTILLFLSE